MQLSLHTTGDSIIISRLTVLEKKAGDLSGAFKKIADHMMKSHEMNFKSQGARFGKKWSPQKHRYGNQLMVRTGALSRGFKSSYNKKSATIENIVKYAGYHQGGTRKMVARPVVGWADKDLNEIIRTLRKDVLGE